MHCPACGKKTIFDWARCPACGCDPWSTGETAAPAKPAKGAGLPARIAKYFTQRTWLSFVFVLLGWLQLATLGWMTLASLPELAPATAGPGQFLAWIWSTLLAAVPALLLLAVGEGLHHLASIREAITRRRTG